MGRDWEREFANLVGKQQELLDRQQELFVTVIAYQRQGQNPPEDVVSDYLTISDEVRASVDEIDKLMDGYRKSSDF